MLNLKDIIFPFIHSDYIYDIYHKPIKNGSLISYYSAEFPFSYLNRNYAIVEYVCINDKHAVLLHGYRSSWHFNIFFINKMNKIEFLLENFTNISFLHKEEYMFYFKKIKAANYRKNWKNIPNLNYDNNGIYLNYLNHKEYIFYEKNFDSSYLAARIKAREWNII